MSATTVTEPELDDLEEAPDARPTDAGPTDATRPAADASPAADAGSADVEATVTTFRLAPVLEPPARAMLAAEPLSAPAPLAGTPPAIARTAARRDATGGYLAERTAPVDAKSPLPDPTAICCSVVQAAVEALRGARPLAQLARWVTPEIYEQLELRAALTRRAHGEIAGNRRAVIRRIRLCRLGDRAAEASVVVDDGARVRAVAIRLEGHRGQWRAMALVIG